MKIKTMIVLAALLCGLLMVGGGVWAISSGSYAIEWDVIGGGGEPTSSADYAIRSTIGQPATETSFSTNYGLWSGYWYPQTNAIGLMEGDTTLNGCLSLSDAMFIAQYAVGSRVFTADQLTCGDTTDDNAVSLVDAMHTAQWVFDVAFKPLWESPDDDNMLEPVRC